MSPLKKRTPFRPALEPLEDRCVPATFTVTNLNNDGDGSLRWAIGQAYTNSGDDTITFADNVRGSIDLTSTLELQTPPDRVTIRGPGADLLTVRRSVANEFRIFLVSPGAG